MFGCAILKTIFVLACSFQKRTRFQSLYTRYSMRHSITLVVYRQVPYCDAVAWWRLIYDFISSCGTLGIESAIPRKHTRNYGLVQRLMTLTEKRISHNWTLFLTILCDIPMNFSYLVKLLAVSCLVSIIYSSCRLPLISPRRSSIKARRVLIPFHTRIYCITSYI